MKLTNNLGIMYTNSRTEGYSRFDDFFFLSTIPGPIVIVHIVSVIRSNIYKGDGSIIKAKSQGVYFIESVTW